MGFHETKVFRNTFLIEYLSARFTYYSKEQWMQTLATGLISKNGELIYNDCYLKPEDKIGFQLPEEISREPDVNPHWKLLEEDDSLFVVDKPPDLPVHPAGRYRENSLLRILEKQFPEKVFLPCHRLDRETSGVLVFAKNPRAGKILSKQFQKKSIRKEYLVWVYGDFSQLVGSQDSLEVRGYLIPDENSPVRKKLRCKFQSIASQYETPNSIHAKLMQNEDAHHQMNPPTYMGLDKEGGKNFAITIFSLKKIISGMSLLSAIPITGKTHQIRAMLESLGYPLLGDKIYGRDSRVFLDFIRDGWNDGLLERVGHHRQALHCWKMQFIHPDTGEVREFVSEVPEDLVFPEDRQGFKNSKNLRH